MRPGVVADRVSTMLIAATGTVATAAVAAVVVSSRAILPSAETRALPPTIPFTSSVESVSALANRAATQLFDWLAVIGWGTLVVGLVAALSLWADRAARTRSEVGVHRAIGASRRVLIRGSLGEGVRLALLVLLAGLAIGVPSGRLLRGPWSPSWDGVTTGLIPVAVVVVATLLLGACFPLWAARPRRPLLVDEAPSPLGIAAVQLGASLALLVAGGMVVERTRAVTAESRPEGIDPTAAVFQIATVGGKPLDLTGFVDRARADGQAISLTQPGGHLGLGAVDELITDCGQCYVGGIFLKWRPLRASYLTASADTFDARRLPVLEGRGFNDEDRVGTPPVAIVNVHLARRYFQNGEPVGREVFLGGRMSGTAYRVVGVVDDRRPIGLGGGAQPLEAIYLSALQHPGSVTELLLPNGHLPPSGEGFDVTGRDTGAGLVQRAQAPMRWFGRWFLVEGALALLLAMAGTATLMTLWVRSLRPELAVRRAVGARHRDVVLLVLARAARTGLTGVGVALAFFGPAIWPELGSVVPGVPVWEPRLVLQGAVLLVAVALIAAVAPLGRMGRTSPADLWSSR